MRRESSTVVVLVGEVGEGLLAGLARSANVSVARAAAAGPPGQEQRPGWEPGAAAMREAARRASTYVVVPDDPLAAVASSWRAMWDLSAQPGAAAFEQAAADALAAWRARQFELPDYYLVVAPALAGDNGQDLYLGPLRAARPRRVAVAAVTDIPAQASQLARALRSLEHGPWWPPLDELVRAIRGFYPGAIGQAEPAAR